MGFLVQPETDGGTPSVSLDCTPAQKQMFAQSRSPFLPQSWFHQDPSPASLHLKEESVRVSDQVVRAGLDEESVSELRFENNLVQEQVLPALAEAGTKSTLSHLTHLLQGQPLPHFPSTVPWLVRFKMGLVVFDRKGRPKKIFPQELQQLRVSLLETV